MKVLYDEVIHRFPEVQSRLYPCDENLPAIVLSAVASWLQDLGPDMLSPDVVKRVREFARWCENQPQGETADDDIMTMYTVSFVEKLFGSSVTRPLIPRIMSKQNMISGAHYLKRCVGAENYQAVLDLYP